MVLLGINDLANDLLQKQKGIVGTRTKIDKHLKELSLGGDNLTSRVEVSGAKASDDFRLRQLLEKLDLVLGGDGKLGLGSDNLLFMASELLLLAQEEDGNRLLLIEEPEAHLHPQRQLRVIKALQRQAKDNGIQVIVTTHSPNLASAIELDNMVLIHQKQAFSLAKGQTELAQSDYRFLQRFLDVTKANLFFARAVVIVEGDSENILLPTLAGLIDRDFTKHGVSIVNVGGVGLRRYARIFRRKEQPEERLTGGKQTKIPVACITDLDVMPDCAPVIVGKLGESDEWPGTSGRRWRAKRDIGDALPARRQDIATKASGQFVRTFVSDEWTLEYNLALGPRSEVGGFSGGLAEDVYVAACLAERDDAINAGKKTFTEVEADALEKFAVLKQGAAAAAGCSPEEVVASKVYAKFAKDGVSKTVTAQYMADRLQAKYQGKKLTSDELRLLLPSYLTEAIDYVTGPGAEDASPSQSALNDE